MAKYTYTERDRDLNIPFRLAVIVAEITSGVDNATPESIDKDRAAKVYNFIESMVNED